MKETLSVVCSLEMPSGSGLDIVRRRFEGRPGSSAPGSSVAIVAGIQGDSPEAIRIVHELTLVMRELEDLRGSVDLYPCVNPLATHLGRRRWPFFDVDMNCRFPGRADGHPPDRVARTLVEEIGPCDLVLELQGATPGFREMIQAEVRAGFPKETELAQHANVELVWERVPGARTPTTFTAQFSNAIALGGGMDNWLNPDVGKDLVAGILNLLAHLGMVDESAVPVHWATLHRARCVTDDHVQVQRADRGGMFFPEVDLGDELDVGETLGRVIDPIRSEELQVIRVDRAGQVMALREHPVVSPGTLVARLAPSEEESCD